jgi:hypothetical protein
MFRSSSLVMIVLAAAIPAERLQVRPGYKLNKRNTSS